MITVLIGPAGVGKSTWCQESGLPSTAIVCLDQLRAEISDDECDQDATVDAVALMDLRLAARLRRRLPTVIDATNVDARVRRPLLDLAAAHGVPARAVVFDAALDVVLARNAERPGPLPGRRWGRAVPVEVVTAQHTATEQLLANLHQLYAEGFDVVEVHTVSAAQPDRRPRLAVSAGETQRVPACIQAGPLPEVNTPPDA